MMGPRGRIRVFRFSRCVLLPAIRVVQPCRWLWPLTVLLWRFDAWLYRRATGRELFEVLDAMLSIGDDAAALRWYERHIDMRGED